MTVTVVIVSWNTRELLARCLESFTAAVEDGIADVWVVDNESTDGSPELVRERARWATLVEPGANIGFGRAVNLVARRTRGEWLVCANADIALEPGALQALLDAGADDRVAAVCPQLLLPDGTAEYSLHSLPTIPFTLALNLGLHRLSSRLRRRMLIPGLYELDRSREVPWAIGAFLLLRRQAFESVGGFDERQWIYAEDLDLGWRLHDAGWLMRYEPGARVRHESGAATRAAFGEQRRARFMRETYAVIIRRRGLTRACTTAAINVLGAAARVLWMSALASVLPRWRAPLADNRSWLAAHSQGLWPRSTPLGEG